MKIQKHIKIYGKVQGVGYRCWLKTFAIKYEIFGWVKNNLGGEVEAVLIGQEEEITNLIELCYMGSPDANVEKIIVNNWNNQYDVHSFKIISDN